MHYIHEHRMKKKKLKGKIESKKMRLLVKTLQIGWTQESIIPSPSSSSQEGRKGENTMKKKKNKIKITGSTFINIIKKTHTYAHTLKGIKILPVKGRKYLIRF